MTDTNLDSSSNQAVLARVVDDYLKERQRKRRWGIFFKVIFIAWLIWTTIVISRSNQLNQNLLTTKPHTALIDIHGDIFDDSAANSDNVGKSLNGAFTDTGTAGIILRINSPGGSAVQASYIYNEIRRLKALHPKIKVYAVCSDICTSAAYFIAAAADQIYANPSSIVGSIGVLYNGFGFVGVMDKLGIERRLVTAGTNKGFMDPFSPMNSQQKDILKTMLDEVHQSFEKSVMEGRGKRLVKNPDIFSGLFWTGERAKELGLIDAFGSAGSVARDVIKNTNVVDYTVRANYIERLARRFGLAFSEHISNRLGLEQSNRLIASK